LNKVAVITTINGKTKAISELEKSDWHVVVVGDEKGPGIRSTSNLTFLSVKDQKGLGYDIYDHLPFNHYSRKNIGYLYAIRQGADVIFDTDDDNIPNFGWKSQDLSVPAFECSDNVSSEFKYLNMYRLFTRKNIWPRGLPLDEVLRRDTILYNHDNIKIGVWQGLADGDPDVDAIYRLTVGEKVQFFRAAMGFRRVDYVGLNKGTLCPFNSQNTIWHKDAFKYMYLPTSVSFRFTDILRGYIAQPLMWKQDLHLGFMMPTVDQKRNKHDLMKDFKDEVSCYTDTKKIVDFIDSYDYMEFEQLYEQLYSHGFIKSNDFYASQAWSEHFE